MQRLIFLELYQIEPYSELHASALPGKVYFIVLLHKKYRTAFSGARTQPFHRMSSTRARKELCTIAGDRNEANYLAYLSLFRPVWYPIDAKGIPGQQSQFSVSTYSATL